jgi:hypothetical protein
MSYYPLSQIKTNLYTNGKEFTLTPYAPGNSYIGSYWSTSDGKFFTGKTPQDTPNNEIFKISQINFNKYSDIATNPTLNYIATNGGFEVVGGDNTEGGDPTVLNYIALKNIPENTVKSLPYYNPTIPIPQDYQIGEFRRYFCKKTNELLYIEIDKSTYDKLVNKDPQIMWQLYTPINLAWQISGNKEKVANTNKNMISLAIQRQKLYRFDEYLKFDYTKYFL